jgi:FlgD Ig-like domain
VLRAPNYNRPALRRNATLAVVLALLMGSALAFGVAERLKIEKSPVAGTEVDKVFSPVCRCPQRVARISFRLRRSDKLTLTLLDADGKRVRKLVDGERRRRGPQQFVWDGRDDDGRLLPEGAYRPKVVLGRADRTIVLPNPIHIDVTPPTVAVTKVRPRVISPDGDAHGDVARIRYRMSEPGRAILFVNGRKRVVSRRQRPSGQLQWVGGGAGGRPGRYRLAVQAQDLAGNLSRRVAAGTVAVRYVRLAGTRLEAQPGRRVRVNVDADAPRVAWLLRRGSSIVRRGRAGRAIVVSAPAQPGRYVLVVSTGPHSARAVLFVRRAS